MIQFPGTKSRLPVMDSKLAYFLSGMWVLTKALTLQPCDNFQLASGHLNNISCIGIKNNATVTWRFGKAGETGHLVGECHWPPLSDDGLCSATLLGSLIVARRTSHDSSILIINASSKLPPGFVSCTALDNGETAKCNFHIVSPAPPSKPIFKILNSPKNTVKEFDHVVFDCKSNGAPTPEVTVGNSLGVLTSGLSSVSFNITVSCQDTGSYYCGATNGIEAGDMRSEASLAVQCSPRIPDNSTNLLRVKFTGHPAKHTFDVIAFPPPQLHNLTILDLESVKFISYSNESDMNVTCSPTETRPYLSVCTLYINYISLSSKTVAVYRVILRNQLGWVAVNVKIEQGTDEGNSADDGYLRGMGVGAGAITAGYMAVAIVTAAFVIFRNHLRSSGFQIYCCCRCISRNKLTGLQGGSQNKGPRQNGGKTVQSRPTTQCDQQGQNGLEEEYEVTDDSRYTQNSATNNPAGSSHLDEDAEYVQI